MTGMVLARPQTPPEAAVPPRSRLGRCLFLAASHNLCPCGFRGRLGYVQGLFPVFKILSGHLSAASSSVIQTLAQAPGLIQTTTLRKRLDQPRQALCLLAGKRSDAKGGNRRTSCKKDPPSPAPQLPAAAKQIKVTNLVLYLLQPDSAEFHRDARQS